jgi:ankyrin repeat protein
MSTFVSRRALLRLVPSFAIAAPFSRQPDAASSTIPSAFPAQDAAVVREMVSVSHGNVARVKELVAARPALARAAWEWGYGDWETALGAASHVGNREIAELLLANGAQPTMFSAAMLGHLDVVKAFVSATPGAQRIRGPHGITLLAHAKAGGSAAADVLRYLESLGDADRPYTNAALGDEEVAALAGTYLFGPGATERLLVARTPRGDLGIKREGQVERVLSHQGSRVFVPAGAEAVRIRFEPAAGRAGEVIVEDGGLLVRARRSD